MNELRDLRAAIPVLTDQVLDAVAHASGQTKQEIVRAVLTEWADKKLHEATLIDRFTRCDGRPRSPAE